MSSSNRDYYYTIPSFVSSKLSYEAKIIIGSLAGSVLLPVLICTLVCIVNARKFRRLSDAEKAQYLDRERQYYDAIDAAKNGLKTAKKAATEASEEATRKAQRTRRRWRRARGFWW